jgi:NAD(P)-dependent dehydrogenase (short-subunit alcohol dehydrogenase family)
MLNTDFESQRIVILGGTSGIGLATAERAAAEGAAVVIASSHPDRIDSALDLLPDSAEGYTVDVRREDEVRESVRPPGQLRPSGVHRRRSPADRPDRRDGPRRGSSRARRPPVGRRRGGQTRAGHLRAGGSIVLSTGIAAPRPEPGWTVAASICGALDALTRALAVELAPLRVNAVSPGVVRSNLWRDMTEEDRSAMYDSLSEALPVGRVGEVHDIAETFLYLMRNGHSSGTIVTIDGGSVLV